LRAQLADESGWILVLREPFPDWRGYQHMNLEIANPTGESLHLVLRVFDQPRGQRRRTGYRGLIEVPPYVRRRHTVALSDVALGTSSSTVDIAQVQSIVIAPAAGNRAPEFNLGRIWLD
jgi:hypothetical protein